MVDVELASGFTNPFFQILLSGGERLDQKPHRSRWQLLSDFQALIEVRSAVHTTRVLRINPKESFGID